MNTKHSILATALGLGLAAVASADTTTTIVLTGSTAFRSAAHAAIQATMTGETFAYSGTDITAATYAIFTEVTGVSPNQNTLIVKTSWTGSAAGIRDVAQGNTVKVIPSSQTQTVGGTASVPVDGNGVLVTSENLVADAAMSDVFQASTIYTTPTLVDNKVAVVPFTWVANDGAPAELDAMTPLLARALFSNGSLPLSMFTGLPADNASFVFATGRDPESGTRITAAAESGQGVFASAVHYQPGTITGDVIQSHQIWPAQVTPIAYDAGNNGYTSGGNLRSALAAKSFSTLGGYYVSYLGINDSNTVVTGGGKRLKWNGVDYSDNNVREGKYSFWGYQHMFYRSTLTGTHLTKVNAIRDNIVSTVAAPNVKLTDMKVSRISDGTLIGSTLGD
ncbi:hypothetical protein [Luteolibacter soli]|uniref:Uncharacterized protein n=1 Tax=Luteolibacter soli TaxID=3135280 RepID=A0ABU9AVZ0_9BACT